MENLEVMKSTVRWILSEIHVSDMLLSILGLFVFLSIYQRLTTKGPMLWPLVGMIPSLVRHADELHDWNSRELLACGGTFRYAGFWMSNCHGVVTSDPAKVEYMLKTHFLNFPKGSYYRERFADLLGDGIFNADGDIWKEQRRLATSQMHTTRFMEYSFRSMQKLVHEKLLPLMKKHATLSPEQESTTVDLQEWLLRFTFDNVCMVALGVDSGCLAAHLPEIPFAKAFEEATEYSLLRFLVPPFWWKLLRRLDLGTERRLREAVAVVHDFADKTVKNRKVDPITSHHNDLLSRLIDLNAGGFAFSDRFLRDFCISLILAGRDTSSVALTWFFWLVHHHPHVEAKILEEMDDVIIGQAGDVMFEEKELERMVYLQAALSEAMRLYPPVPVDFKEATEDDVYPDGMEVKKGARVFYHVYGMGRVESIWGPDCHVFRPERWIKSEGGFVSQNPFKYAVFNAGPRLCVGKKFAYMQMKMVAASVLFRYRVKVNEAHPVASKITTTLYMKYGLQVSFLPRFHHHSSIKIN
ncbi:hypothetical protein V2J09_015474 [Rumex salicifolius]